MAFVEHPEFQSPEDSNARIWRYMDLAKFISLIDRSALFFVRVDKLEKEDPFEGFYTNLNVVADKFMEFDVGENAPSKEVIQQHIQLNHARREHAKADRAKTFICSWHAQDHESAAMWKLYVKSDEGIAIESSYVNLIESLRDYQEFEVNVGMVKYIDYSRELISLGNGLAPFMHKRKSFEHERELRALIWTPQHGKNTIGVHPINKYEGLDGLHVPVKLETLISRIRVAPTAQPWIYELIQAVVKKYDLEIPVERSDLAAKPMY